MAWAAIIISIISLILSALTLARILRREKTYGRTRTGVLITEELVQEKVRDAERGYDAH